MHTVRVPTRLAVVAAGLALAGAMLSLIVSGGDGRAYASEVLSEAALPEDTLAVYERVSVDSAEVQGDSHSSRPAVSADGRYVAFQSGASNLVPGDANEWQDIFVRDRAAGTTERVSIAAGGAEADEASYNPAISADGRYVAFYSDAANLVPGDTNEDTDVFLYDRQTGIIERVNLSSAGEQAEITGSQPFLGSSQVSLSADGRFVAFTSLANNLVAGDTSKYPDVFVRDLQEGITERISVSATATEVNGYSDAPSLSADGRYVAFDSAAGNLVTGDGNGYWDVFVRDRTAGTTELVSLSSSGGQGNEMSGNPCISADGRYIAFESYAWNLVTGDNNWTYDVFVRDLQADSTTRVSVSASGYQLYGDSDLASISGDGRYVAFESYASDAVAGDTNKTWDIFIRDRTLGTTQRVSASSAGAEADKESWQPVMSADGDYVVFGSDATNLVAGDTNGSDDVFAVHLRDYASIRGEHRYHTAQLISRAMFPVALPAGAGLVVAPGETFPEALCGAPLAAAWGGPVLLTYKTALDNGTKAELERLGPSHVFCIGLDAAVVTAIEGALPPPAEVQSITGATVYAMSRNVAGALAAKVDESGDMSQATAIVTRGTNFPDAIGVAPLACHEKWPILLDDNITGSLNADATAALSDLGITKALKVGTYVELPSGIEGVANLSGTDRYYTNAKVAAWAAENVGLTFDHLAFATGDKFPDALASGPYLAKDDGILLLSPLLGPLPAAIKAVILPHQGEAEYITYIACIEPVIGQVKALLP